MENRITEIREHDQVCQRADLPVRRGRVRSNGKAAWLRLSEMLCPKRGLAHEYPNLRGPATNRHHTSQNRRLWTLGAQEHSKRSKTHPDATWLIISNLGSLPQGEGIAPKCCVRDYQGLKSFAAPGTCRVTLGSTTKSCKLAVSIGPSVSSGC